MRFPGCLSLSTLATSASICNVQRITRRTSWVAVTGLAAEHDDANRTLPLPAAIMEYAVEAFMCRNRMPRCQSISEATGRGTCTYIDVCSRGLEKWVSNVSTDISSGEL